MIRQERIQRSLGVKGRLDIVFGGLGAAAGGACGGGLLSGAFAVLGGAGGFAIGSVVSNK